MIWNTNHQVQHSHERPALSLLRIDRVLLCFFWYRTPSLTQISSILTPFSASWLLRRYHRPTSCPSVNTGDIIRMSAISKQCPAHPNRILPRRQRQLRNRMSMLHRSRYHQTVDKPNQQVKKIFELITGHQLESFETMVIFEGWVWTRGGCWGV
jgi:hypothetical protein